MEKELLESLLEEAQVDEGVTIKEVDDNEVVLTNGNTYRIYNDTGRKVAIQNEILETFPYFNSSFLASFTKLPQVVFESLDDSISPDDVEKLLGAVNSSIEELAEKVVEADSYAHFLSYYDNTTELNLIDNLYAYRID